eukprot:gene22618-34614_t
MIKRPREYSKTVDRWGISEHKLGTGAFGKVVRGIDLHSGNLVAVKIMSLEGLRNESFTALKTELDLLKSLSHENVVQYIDAKQTPSNFYIVMQLMDRGSVCDMLHQHGAFPPVYAEKRGPSGQLSPPKDRCAGTPYWMSPEAIQGYGTAAASDIWGLGVTVCEMLTTAPPYGHLSPHAALYHTVTKDTPPLPTDAGCLVHGDVLMEPLRQFLTACLQKSQALRPTATQLLGSEWISLSVKACDECGVHDLSGSFEALIRAVRPDESFHGSDGDLLPSTLHAARDHIADEEAVVGQSSAEFESDDVVGAGSVCVALPGDDDEDEEGEADSRDTERTAGASNARLLPQLEEAAAPPRRAGTSILRHLLLQPRAAAESSGDSTPVTLGAAIKSMKLPGGASSRSQPLLRFLRQVHAVPALAEAAAERPAASRVGPELLASPTPHTLAPSVFLAHFGMAPITLAQVTPRASCANSLAACVAGLEILGLLLKYIIMEHSGSSRLEPDLPKVAPAAKVVASLAWCYARVVNAGVLRYAADACAAQAVGTPTLQKQLFVAVADVFYSVNFISQRLELWAAAPHPAGFAGSPILHVGGVLAITNLLSRAMSGELLKSPHGDGTWSSSEEVLGDYSLFPAVFDAPEAEAAGSGADDDAASFAVLAGKLLDVLRHFAECAADSSREEANDLWTTFASARGPDAVARLINFSGRHKTLTESSLFRKQSNNPLQALAPPTPPPVNNARMQADRLSTYRALSDISQGFLETYLSQPIWEPPAFDGLSPWPDCLSDDNALGSAVFYNLVLLQATDVFLFCDLRQTQKSLALILKLVGHRCRAVQKQDPGNSCTFSGILAVFGWGREGVFFEAFHTLLRNVSIAGDSALSEDMEDVATPRRPSFKTFLLLAKQRDSGFVLPGAFQQVVCDVRSSAFQCLWAVNSALDSEGSRAFLAGCLAADVVPQLIDYVKPSAFFDERSFKFGLPLLLGAVSLLRGEEE